MSIFWSAVSGAIRCDYKEDTGRRTKDEGRRDTKPFHLTPTSSRADYNPQVDRPLVSVLIASDRVEGSLSECLASLAAQQGAPEFEVVVASSRAPDPASEPSLDLIWVEVADRNPSVRRNRAAAGSLGSV